MAEGTNPSAQRTRTAATAYAARPPRAQPPLLRPFRALETAQIIDKTVHEDRRVEMGKELGGGQPRLRDRSQRRRRDARAIDDIVRHGGVSLQSHTAFP
jgi:hypothetical protein